MWFNQYKKKHEALIKKKEKGNWVKPKEKFCIFARMALIFRHWCKRQGFQRFYLVVLNDIVYEETDITHIQMPCSLVVEKPIWGVVCRNWRRRRRRWEAKSRRRKTPRRSKSYQSTPTGLSSNKLSFSSISLSLSLSHTPAFVYLLLHMFLILFHAYRISWFMQTLHIHGSRPPKTSNTETQDSILGNANCCLVYFLFCIAELLYCYYLMKTGYILLLVECTFNLQVSL